jgi:hypothetical protein
MSGRVPMFVVPRVKAVQIDVQHPDGLTALFRVQKCLFEFQASGVKLEAGEIVVFAVHSRVLSLAMPVEKYASPSLNSC